MFIVIFNIEYLSPTGFIGFWVLFVGLIFTGIMLNFVFFRLNENDNSYKDKIRKESMRLRREERVARLYPKKE